MKARISQDERNAIRHQHTQVKANGTHIEASKPLWRSMGAPLDHAIEGVFVIRGRRAQRRCIVPWGADGLNHVGGGRVGGLLVVLVGCGDGWCLFVGGVGGRLLTAGAVCGGCCCWGGCCGRVCGYLMLLFVVG